MSSTTARIWKLEPLGKPEPAHAADAVEIVQGEAVRRVALSQLDYDTYLCFRSITARVERAPLAQELARELALPLEDTEAALRRLAACGLIELPAPTVLQ